VHLKTLSLRQFRNHPRLDLALAPGLNLFIGANGAGKSNLLEAVSLLATGDSHRGAEGRNLFLWDTDELAVDGAFDGEEPLLVSVRQHRGRPRQVKVNNASQRRLRDWVGRAPAITFSPEDLDLVKGEPSLRRRALNDILQQGVPGYADLLQRYTKVVEERNAALKAVQERRAPASALEPWDLALLKEGAALTQARADFIKDFSPLVETRHRTLSTGKETAALAYKPSFLLAPSAEPSAVAQAAAANRRRLLDLRDGEVATGSTLAGPHRDDMEISIEGRPAKAFASQGQQRTLAISFKLAERDFLKAALGREPLCLLDDMLSELDPGRRRSLRLLLDEGGQCLVTMTSIEDWETLGSVPAGAAVFSVMPGGVSPAEVRA
jgi:DNA replication and repair protein RecF